MLIIGATSVANVESFVGHGFYLAIKKGKKKDKKKPTACGRATTSA